MSMDKDNFEDVDQECPLCVEQFDYDDFDFFPCPCGYQICRFCWHKLINQEDKKGGKGGRGLCPACRQEYPESPARFNGSLTIEAVEELVKNKKKKKKAQKAKSGEKVGLVSSIKKEERNLSGLRVVQKNLVFVIGIPIRLSQEDLRREFSKYGKIHKLAVGHNNNSSVNSVYVTYSRPEDAIRAIQALNHQNNGNNHIIMNGLGKSKNGSNITLKASLGTTKYCTHWLKNQQCPKLPDCMYLHELAEPEASFTKEEMQQGKHTEYEKKLISQYLKEKGANTSSTKGLNNVNNANAHNSTRRSGHSNGHSKDTRSNVVDTGGTSMIGSNCTNGLISGSAGISGPGISVGSVVGGCGSSDNHNNNHNSGNKSDSDGEGCEDRISNERLNKMLSMDELVGVSNDSSTSFSTCSSGSSGTSSSVSARSNINCGSNSSNSSINSMLKGCVDGLVSKDSGLNNENGYGIMSSNYSSLNNGSSNASPSIGLSGDDEDREDDDDDENVDDEDDGLDFDPITVSTTGLRDLIANCRESITHNSATPSVSCVPTLPDQLCRSTAALTKLLLPPNNGLGHLSMSSTHHYHHSSNTINHTGVVSNGNSAVKQASNYSNMIRPDHGMYSWYNSGPAMFNGPMNSTSLVLNSFLGQPMGSKQPPPGFV